MAWMDHLDDTAFTTFNATDLIGPGILDATAGSRIRPITDQ
jgi:hypothetical protein